MYEPELAAVSDGEGEAEQQQARLQPQQRLEVVTGAAQHSQHRPTQPQVEEPCQRNYLEWRSFMQQSASLIIGDYDSVGYYSNQLNNLKIENLKIQLKMAG